MTARKWVFAGLCVCMALACSSCVPCDHPLTDQRSSVADEGLIGDWLLSNGSEEPPTYFSIGKKHGSPNVLECVASGVGEQNEVEIERQDIFTTKIGTLRLATHENDGADEDRKTWSIYLLEFPDKNTAAVYVMDPEVLAKAIENKQLSGEVKKTWFFGWHSYPSRIENTPDELREYIKTAGKKCFDTKSPVWTITRAVRR